nr:hypothetical protein [Bacillus badius]
MPSFCALDWNGRREDSCGISGTGETPQELWRRGGSPPAPRKAKRLEWKATALIRRQTKKDGRHSVSLSFFCDWSASLIIR